MSEYQIMKGKRLEKMLIHGISRKLESIIMLEVRKAKLAIGFGGIRSQLALLSLSNDVATKYAQRIIKDVITEIAQRKSAQEKAPTAVTVEATNLPNQQS